MTHLIRRSAARPIAGALVLCAAALFFSVASDACEGRIVRVADGADVPFAEFRRKAAAARVVALGERHGVAAHPRAAACLLSELVQDGAPVSLAVEHIASDRQTIVEAVRAANPETPDRLGVALRWWETGWPAWKVYAPLFAAAWRHRLPVIAADRPPGRPLPPAAEVVAELGPGGRAVLASWTKSLRQARCGLGDAAELRRAAVAQAARDLHFATFVRAGGDRVLFFAGRAHVRLDRGLSERISIAPDKLLSVALQETATGDGPVDVRARLADANGRFDFVWLIGETRDQPVCARLRRLGLLP